MEVDGTIILTSLYTHDSSRDLLLAEHKLAGQLDEFRVTARRWVVCANTYHLQQEDV